MLILEVDVVVVVVVVADKDAILEVEEEEELNAAGALLSVDGCEGGFCCCDGEDVLLTAPAAAVEGLLTADVVAVEVDAPVSRNKLAGSCV